MRLINAIIMIHVLLFTSSCQKKTCDFVAMPPEPAWVVYTKKPVIEKIEKNYLVSDEFVESALQHKQYTDKVLKWKLENQVP